MRIHRDRETFIGVRDVRGLRRGSTLGVSRVESSVVHRLDTAGPSEREDPSVPVDVLGLGRSPLSSVAGSPETSVDQGGQQQTCRTGRSGGGADPRRTCGSESPLLTRVVDKGLGHVCLGTVEWQGRFTVLGGTRGYGTTQGRGPLREERTSSLGSYTPL